MIDSTALLIGVTHVLITALAAPLLPGLIQLIQARLQGRRGPALFQPYLDLRKLLAKEAVQPAAASWLFSLTPYLTIAILLTVSLLIPLLSNQPPLGFTGDIIVLAFLFLAPTCFRALAGWDAGTSFGGIGASRAMLVAALATPTLITVVFALATEAATINLGGIAAYMLGNPLLLLHPGCLLAFAACCLAITAEAGYLPIAGPSSLAVAPSPTDDLATAYTGRLLALMEWAAALRLFLLLALLSNLFAPWGISITTATPADAAIGLGIAALALLPKLALLALFIATLGILTAKLRAVQATALLGSAFVLAMLAITAFFVM